MSSGGQGIELHGVRVRRVRLGAARVAALSAVAAGILSGIFALLWAALPVRDGSMELPSDLLALASTGLGALGLALAAVALAAAAIALLARARPATLAVGEAGITLERGGAVEVIAHERVRSGIAHGRRATLKLHGGGALHVEDVGEADAEALFDAVAAGAAERALDLDLQRRAGARRTAYAVLLLPILLGGVAMAAAFASLEAVIGTSVGTALAWWLLQRRLHRPDRLVVGHDGVAITDETGTRFVPYAGLHQVGAAGDAVELDLADGTSVLARLLTPGRGPAREMAERRRDHLVERIRAQLAAYRAGGDENPQGADRLERGGRTLAAWRLALRDLVTRPRGSYREAPVDPEQLARVLWARDVDPERRLGAALALAESGDAANLRRVRVFIDTCARDQLRDTVEQTVAGELDDAELDRALGRLAPPR
jgi:hypothetical protein